MPSKLGVFKQAQGRLRSNLSTDADPLVDPSIQTEAMDREYETVKEKALTAHPWSFARTLVSVSANVSAPPLPWVGKYAVPITDSATADRCLAVFTAYDPTSSPRPWPNERQVDWQVWQEEAADTNALWIYADTDADLIIGCINEIETGVWPEWFADFVAWGLAATTAMTLTGDMRLAQYCEQKAAQAKMEAIDHDRRHTPGLRTLKVHPYFSARVARLGRSATFIEGETP